MFGGLEGWTGQVRFTYPRKASENRYEGSHCAVGGTSLSEATDVTVSNSYIDSELVERLRKVEEEFNADVITCIHPIMEPFDDIIRQRMDDLEDKKDNLLVILETPGGSIETTERIVTVLRHHYPNGEVTFLIPNHAMSAGTILVMSGDRILMDYYSVLGPIDPQIQNTKGEWVPGLGYLEKYKELIEKSTKGNLSQAELAFLIDKFDPAHLHWLEQAREHGVDLLKKWLVQYKFKNWARTQTKNKVVTQKMKGDRAASVAKKLNDTKLWRSHGRGLSIEVVRQTLKLEVEDFGTDARHEELNKRVCAYYRLLKDYMGRRAWNFAVQTREGRFVF